MTVARPKKDGLEYFGLDVYMGIDDEVELLEAEHGLEGFAIFIKLLQTVYRKGYYTNWTDKDQLLFSKRVNVAITQVNAVITSALKWGLFDKALYERHVILTSHGIQQRFLLAIGRRTSAEIRSEYLLLSGTEVNVAKNLVIVTKTIVNDDNNPQSKVKESKVKESIVEEVIETPTAILQKEIENSFGKLASPYEIELLESYLKEGMDIKLIIKAVHESADSGARVIKYTKTILNRCIDQKILTLDRYLLDQENRRKEKKNGECSKNDPGDNAEIELSPAELAAKRHRAEQIAEGRVNEEEAELDF